MGICMKFVRVRKKTRGLMGIRAQVCASKAIYPEKVPNRSHFPLDYFLRFHQYRVVHNVRYSRTLSQSQQHF